MNNTLKSTLIGVIIPGIVIIAASKLNDWLGIVVLLIYLATVAYLNRGFIYGESWQAANIALVRQMNLSNGSSSLMTLRKPTSEYAYLMPTFF